MADKNRNNQVDPDEAEDTVEEEDTVSEAFQDDKITKEEAEKIDDLRDLEAEAEKIKMTEEMGKAVQSVDIKPADAKEDMPDIEISKQEEKTAASVPAPTEATQEATKEQTSEPVSETSTEQKEVKKEFKQGV